MEQSIFSFSIDKDLKKQFDLLCEDFGMTASAVINIFVKSVVKDRKIPFEVSADPFYREENINELKRRIANLEAGVTTLKEHELIEVD